MLTSLLKVRYPLHGDERIGFDFEIGWKEYASIGYVVVQWAFLEYALHERIVAFAKRARIKVPKNARSFSFSKRVRALRELISKTIKDPNANKRWLDLLSRISNAAGRRQKVAHGLWAYNPARAERLWTEGANQKSKRADKFDFKELGEFGASIGQLSFELLHPRPGTGRPSTAEPPFAYWSRSFLLTLQGKDPEELGLPLLIREEPKPPQKSSEK